MKAPLIKFGDFEFLIGHTVFEDSHQVTKKITFKISPECPVDTSFLKEGEMNELIAEKLKQDFLKLLNKKAGND